jgi:hypothetical protein
MYKLPQLHYSPDCKFNYKESVIVHTHDPFFTTDSNVDISLINLTLVKRRDLFAQLMSCQIAKRSGQWVQYTDSSIDKFVYDKEYFIQELCNALKWYNDLDLGKMYNTISVVYFEDFINDKKTYSSNKSPFDYKNIISNWEFLKEEYDKIMQVYNAYGYSACIRF